MPTAYTVFSLGNTSSLGLSADLDPVEGGGNGNLGAENGAELNGLTFGSLANPLQTNATVSMSLVNDGAFPLNKPTQAIYNNNNTFGPGVDTFSIDGGTPLEFDAAMRFSATVTYTDGSTFTQTATNSNSSIVVIQSTNGDLFLLPPDANDTTTPFFTGGTIASITLDAYLPGNLSGTPIDRQNLICFTGGTLIRAHGGDVPIDALEKGDLIYTGSNSFMPILWVGSLKLDKIDLQMNSKLRPVRIKAGAIGEEMPNADLLVSCQHRVLVRSAIAQRMFGKEEVLVPAIKLIELDGIKIDEDIEEVEYFHILFDQHVVILSNGAWTESLFTGPEALKAVSSEARKEIETLFPEICDPDFSAETAYTFPKTGKLMKQLIARHKKNNKPLYSN